MIEREGRATLLGVATFAETFDRVRADVIAPTLKHDRHRDYTLDPTRLPEAEAVDECVARFADYEINPPPGKGRPKGSKNKAPAEVVRDILATLPRLDTLKHADGPKKGKPVFPGGYLLCIAQTDPSIFAALMRACLPKDMNLNVDLQMSYDEELAALEAKAKAKG